MASKAEPEFIERRKDDRHRSVLAIGKIIVRGQERFCLIRDVSSGGLMIEISDPPIPGEPVMVETLGLRLVSATIAWRDGQIAGLSFDAPQDADVVCRRGVSQDGLIIRGPRFRTDRVARLRTADRESTVEVVNISVGGARLRGASGLVADVPGQLVMGSPMPLLSGYVRWSVGDEAGFRFAPVIDRQALLTLIA